MAVTDVTDVTDKSPVKYYTRKEVASNNSEMGMDDFFQLLAAQLRYQDMSDPMSNSEMMSQLTQMANMSAMTTLSDTIETISETVDAAINSMAQISLSSYATNLMGKEVTVAELDEKGELIGETTGVVEGVMLTGGNPYVYVDGKAYSLSQIMSVGSVPDQKEEPDTEDVDREDTDKDENIESGEV